MSKKKKQIRQSFRNAVFSRDSHKCVFCDKTEELDAHHITDRNLMPNGGYVKENGITVCQECHKECETFHITNGDNFVEGKHPDDLYKLIGSSKDEAIRASKRLSL
jgi:5-methylcytosine-specific restriction endonuclease McrA